jgi:hypothetical protein
MESHQPPRPPRRRNGPEVLHSEALSHVGYIRHRMTLDPNLAIIKGIHCGAGPQHSRPVFNRLHGAFEVSSNENP